MKTKLYMGNLNDGEILLDAHLLFSPEINSYEKSLKKFSDEKKLYREVLNKPFEVLLDIYNLRELERYNSDTISFQMSKGERPSNLYQIKKCFERGNLNNLPFFRSEDLFDDRNDESELLFIVEIF
jgi:hypothetical protein